VFCDSHNIRFVKHPPPAGGTLFTKEGRELILDFIKIRGVKKYGEI